MEVSIWWVVIALAAGALIYARYAWEKGVENSLNQAHNALLELFQRIDALESAVIAQQVRREKDDSL